MKKIYVIVGLLVLMASCQKEVIRPNECPTQSSTDKRGTTGTNDEGAGGGGMDASDPDNTTTTTDPDSDENEITDPMRKKDKKGTH